MKKRKVGLVLSGCGVFDGSEIHEAVLSMLALAKAGFDVQCIAPNIEQAHVVDHYQGQQTDENERRNVLVESARIARGNIKSTEEVTAKDFDGLFFPGGFGAAKNLCSFAFDGPNARVNDEVTQLIRDTHKAGKPQCFLCISPAIAAKVLGNQVELTIGNHKETAEQLEKMGAKHIEKAVDEAHTDTKNKVVSAAAYMYGDAPITDIEKSINAAVDQFAKLF